MGHHNFEILIRYSSKSFECAVVYKTLDFGEEVQIGGTNLVVGEITKRRSMGKIRMGPKAENLQLPHKEGDSQKLRWSILEV